MRGAIAHLVLASAKHEYADRYLDLLASRTLTEEGVFSDTRRTALEWLLIEAEEKADQIYQLIGTASTRPVVSPRSGEVLPEYTPEKGQLSVGAPLAVGGAALRGLDFDVLSLATIEQRLTILTAILPDRGTPPAEDVSLISRVLYATPAAQFPRLERMLSTSGLMDKLAQMWGPHGELAVIGRIFTVKALEAMQVPGETLEDLPELSVGYDEDGFFHYAYATSESVASRALAPADFGATGQVALGHERALPGEPTADIKRSVITLHPAIIRGGGIIMTFWRGLRKTLIVDDGPPKGPYLPTQLVRVTTLGENGGTRVVTALEAAGMLTLTESAYMEQTVKPVVRGGIVCTGVHGAGAGVRPGVSRRPHHGSRHPRHGRRAWRGGSRANRSLRAYKRCADHEHGCGRTESARAR